MARKSKVPINMSTLLQSKTGTLAHIQTKTNCLVILADIVRDICPDLPEDTWHIANCRLQTLIIEVKSPVWGQRLQFERNKICTVLVENTKGDFNRIEIKVNPQGFQKARYQLTEELRIELEKKSLKHAIKNDGVRNKKTANQFLLLAKKAPKGLKEKLEKLAKVAGKT
jgi:hypothetical protein